MSAQALSTELSPTTNAPLSERDVELPSVEYVVRARAKTMEYLRQAFYLIQEADVLARRACLGGLEIDIQLKNEEAAIFDPKKFELRLQQTLDASGWRYLINESNLSNIVDLSMRTRWTRRLYDGEVLELTLKNVAYAVQAACDAHHERIERTSECRREVDVSVMSAVRK